MEIQTIEERGLSSYEFSNVLNPEGANQIANTIKDYATQNKLVETIKDKPYPMVEAWQYAGLLLGLFPRVTKVEDLSTDKETKYRAEVDVINKQSGEVMATGIAVCSNKESKKKYFEEYAICSMAQTRATGKAFRLLLGWMFKLAGFEPTPAEEMDDKNPNIEKGQPTVNVIHEEYRKFAIEAVKCCYTAGQVKELVDLAPTLKADDAKFIDTAREAYKMLANVSQ